MVGTKILEIIIGCKLTLRSTSYTNSYLIQSVLWFQKMQLANTFWAGLFIMQVEIVGKEMWARGGTLHWAEQRRSFFEKSMFMIGLKLESEMLCKIGTLNRSINYFPSIHFPSSTQARMEVEISDHRWSEINEIIFEKIQTSFSQSRPVPINTFRSVSLWKELK